MIAYGAVLAGCFVLGTLAGWTALARRIDHYAYDLMTVITPVKNPGGQSVVVAIDEATFHERGGPRDIREEFWRRLYEDLATAVQPKAVALDVILPDRGDDAEDARLEAALRGVPQLILGCDLAGGGWEDPLPRFARAAAAIGHVHSEVDRLDGVSREVSLEKIVNHQRRWALALEAFRISRGQTITESPDDLEIGGTVIPAGHAATDRPMLIRYLPDGVPSVSALRVKENASVLRGKTVFLGITALSAARDRLVNPYGQNVPGVEVHAHAFETLARGNFLRKAGNLAPLGMSALISPAAGAGLAFCLSPRLDGLRRRGRDPVHRARCAHRFSFARAWCFPTSVHAAVAWLASAGAATYQHFFVRRQLRRSESEKSRYQQAIHWAAHEMRTPLTAIQGSSEIMTNYSLPEAKQKQLSEMINSESKRLARLIQTFLDVERLADGEMEMKREVFAAAEMWWTHA